MGLNFRELTNLLESSANIIHIILLSESPNILSLDHSSKLVQGVHPHRWQESECVNQDAKLTLPANRDGRTTTKHEYENIRRMSLRRNCKGFSFFVIIRRITVYSRRYGKKKRYKNHFCFSNPEKILLTQFYPFFTDSKGKYILNSCKIFQWKDIP